MNAQPQPVRPTSANGRQGSHIRSDASVLVYALDAYLAGFERMLLLRKSVIEYESVAKSFASLFRDFRDELEDCGSLAIDLAMTHSDVMCVLSGLEDAERSHAPSPFSEEELHAKIGKHRFYLNALRALKTRKLATTSSTLERAN